MSPTVVYRQLGKSGLRVSLPIIGAMSFGHKDWAPWVIEEEQSIEVLKAAWDRGVTTIDTANVYSHGVSEQIIAKFIKKYNIPRQKLLILTKCYALVGENPAVKTFGTGLDKTRDYVNQGGLSRAAIFNAVTASLKRLETDYIDLLQIHRFDPTVPPEETMKALHDLVESGKVRYIGASSMRTWQFAMLNTVAEKHNWTKFVSMQNEYSLLYREEEREMIPYCLHNGIGLIPWAPLAGGHLARPVGTDTARVAAARGGAMERKHSDSDKLIIQRVEEIAKKRGTTMAQVALAWTMAKISSPIVGVSSVGRLEDAMIGELTLTEEETKLLEEPYQPRPIRGHA
ncbi:Aldo/keto reductase [Exidia glandulosa HHB12029]|uniref:Aldo/keto reductase n=1 Tax=Exidia glandulosa HHB12029 TaxID=1314781 RepID=A0A165M6D0_EXIGL|nr:Aldo/keto reductase [Exidia glandulosa HHB12029]